MDKINIYGPTDTLVLSINVDDTSYRYKAIMAENSLNLKFSLPEYIQIEVDSYVDYKAERYFLFEEQTFVKNNTRNFEYNLTLLTHEALLRTKQFKFFLSDELGNTIPPLKVKGSFTGKPLDFLNLIVRNMNDGDTGWTVGSYIEGEQKTLSFNQITCAEFLKQVCDEYKTEYDVVLKTINMGKVEKDKANPLSLSYGKGNGLKSGVKRNNGEASKINRIYVQGGSTNIDKSKYRISNMVGSDILKIPANASKVYNGVTYVSDADGTYVQRSGLTERVREGSYENTDIFPQRIGTVSSVVTIDASKNLYDIVDSSIPVDLNYSDYMIAGEVWTIIFQTGALAGQEFDLAKYYHVADETHAAYTFEIVPKEDAGIAMPSTTLIPAVGDKYIVYHISMPQSYNTTAETDLFDKAAEVLYENEIADYAFDGELDPIYAKANWLAIGSKLNAGNFVSFTDPDFSTEPVIIRINGVREYVNKPYEPSIELNNKTSSKSISSKLKELDSDEVRIDNSKRESISYTKRRWRDALETMGLLEDALKNFAAGINPIWVQTMSILVGEESLQFRFVDDKTTPESVNDSFVWSNTTKVFGSSAAIIQHMTIGVKNLSSSHAAAEYLFWDIPAYTSPVMTDLDPFYIYLKCSKTSSAGEVLMSKTPFDLDPNDGFYYFLSATLGSEVEGERSLITTYGFTEITPGRITLDKIVSPDGYQFWDMLTHAFRIGNADTFLEYANGELVAQRLAIKSPTGDVAYAEIYVGNYSDTRQYYEGEYFDYTDGNQYICTLQPATAGVLPTDDAFFRIRVTRGSNGDWVSYVYKNSATQPTTPTGTNIIPSGWTDIPLTTGTWWMSKATINGVTGLAGTWSYPIQATGTTGATGNRILFKYAQNTSKVTPPAISNNTLNPGAVWTLFPPSLLAGEYLWMTSALVNNDATVLINNWTTPVRISGENGANGLPSIALSLTNEYHGIPTDSAGNNGVYLNAYTILNLYVGGVIQTAGVTTSFTVSDPSITISNPSTFYLGVISMGVDNGYVTCTAAYNGVSYSKQFKLSKIKAGAVGAPGTSYWLNANAEIIVKKTVAGVTTYTPSTLSFYPRKQVGTSGAVAAGTGTTFTMQGWNGTSWVNISSSPYSNPSLLTYTTPAINGTYSQYKGTLLYGSTILDEITVAMVEDAASAKDALASLIGGFASYNDYVNFVSTHGKIIMQGGYINANLIDVDALVANALLVEEMANIAGTYFETDGVTFTQKNGITLPAVINSVATSLDMNPQSLPDIAAFLTNQSLTGTTNLPLVNTNIADRQTIESPSTQASNNYMSIPSGITSIKSNSIAISGDLQINGRESGDRAGFVYKCDLFALFYNGTTFLSQVVIGQYSMDSNSDYRGISYTFPSVSLTVPNGASRVYLHSAHSLYVKTNIGSAPYGDLYINAVAASAIFYNATGVYKSRISPDGYALARDANNFFHLKADSTKVLLSFQGDIASSVTKVSTGVWRIQHDIKSNYGLVPSNYTIHLTIQNGGYNIPGFMYVSAYDTTSYNWTEVRAMNTSGSLIDTEFYITFMRI